MPVGPLSGGGGFAPGPRLLFATPNPFVDNSQVADYESGRFFQFVRRPYRATFVSYALSPPAVVGPGIVFPPVRVRSVQTPRRNYHARSFLSPPTVVNPPPSPPVQTVTRVSLAASSRLGRRPSYELRPPTRVGPGIVFRPIDVNTTVTPRRQRRTVTRIGEPQAIGAALPAPAPLIPLVDVHLAAQPRQTYHVGRYGVAPPTIVGIYPTPDQLVVRSHLTQAPRAARGTHSILRKPLTLIAPLPNRPQTVVSVNLALSERQGRGTHYKLQRPIVVIGVKPIRSQVTIKVVLAASTIISRKAQATKLLPPQVIGPFTPPPPPPPPVIVPSTTRAFIDDRRNPYAYEDRDLWRRRKRS